MTVPGLSFATPAALGLLLPWSAWVLLLLLRPGARRAPAPALLALATAGLLLILAAAQPQRAGAAEARDLVLLLDVSPSLPAGIRDAAARRAETLLAEEPAGRATRLAFAEQPVAVPDAAALAATAATGLDGPTDLTRALDAARELLVPGGGRVLLLSDGRHARSTSGEPSSGVSPEDGRPESSLDLPAAPRAAAAALARAGATLFVAPLWPARAPDVAVRALHAPQRATAHLAVPLQVDVACRGEVDPTAHAIQLLVDGQVRRTLPLRVPCDGAIHPLFATIALDAVGRPLLEARRHGPGADLIAEDDRAGATVEVSGPASLLWLGDGAAVPGHPLRELLLADGHSLRTLSPDQLTASAGELAAQDLIVLDDVPLHRLQLGAEEALEGYVRGGGGLLVLGGPASFGAGGYPGSRLDELLPVASDPRRTAGRMAVVLLVDKSGSMGGYEEGWERLLLAKDTLRKLLATLGRPDDEVAIIGFDVEPRVLLPLTRVAVADPEGLDTGVMQAGGGTDPTPALKAAQLELQGSRAPIRHIVAITDGRFAGPEVDPTVRKLVAAGIHVSTVGIGSTAEMARLEKLATLGQGGVSQVHEARHLPRAVLRELLQAAGGVIRPGPVMVQPGSALAELTGELPLPVPPLDRLNRTLPKEGTVRWLQSAIGEPVLSAARRDAGLVIAFTAAPGRWTSGWTSWAGQTTLWRAVIAAAARRASRPWEASAHLRGERLQLDLRAVQADGLPLTGQRVLAQVTLPRGRIVDRPLQERRPGEYRDVGLAAREPGRYRVMFSVGGATVAEADAVSWTPAEVRQVGNDLPLLEALAALGGGRLLAEGEALPPPRPGVGRERSWTPLALGLGLLALLLYFWLEGRPRRATPATGQPASHQRQSRAAQSGPA